MRKKLFIFSVIIMISGACSESSEEILKPLESKLAISPGSLGVYGVLIDSSDYIDNATVCVDLNQDSKCNSDEPKTLTKEGGFVLETDKLESNSILLAEVDASNSFRLNSTQDIESSYVLRSSLAKCPSVSPCELNISPFTNHLSLSLINEPNKTYSTLEGEVKSFFANYVDLNPVDIDYIAQSRALSLAESSAAGVFQKLALVLIYVVVQAESKPDPLGSNPMQFLAKNIVESVRKTFEIFADEAVDFSGSGVLDLGFVDEVVSDVYNEELVRLEAEPEQLLDVVEESDIAEASDVLEVTDPTESIVAARSSPEIGPQSSIFPDLKRPSLSLVSNAVSDTIFVLNTSSLKISINSFGNDFLAYESQHQDQAIAAGLPSSLVVSFYQDSQCSSLLSSSAVEGSQGVYSMEALASGSLNIYAQVSFADRVSLCSSALSTTVSLYNLDNPESVCNSNVANKAFNSGDPIVICDFEGFKSIRQNLTASYILAADIDLAAPAELDNVNYDIGGWIPFAAFTGSLDGRNHKILNLKINSLDRSDTETHAVQGLFSELGSETVHAEIKNLVLGEAQAQKSCNHVDSDANNDYSGCDIVFSNTGAALIAKAVNGSISGVVNNYAVYGTGDKVGGIVGEISNTSTGEVVFADNETRVSITSSSNNQPVNGNSFIGGIFGNSTGDAQGSSLVNNGNITGLDDNLGGIGGSVSDNPSFSNLENTAKVSEDAGLEACYVGGVFGYFSGSLDKVKNSGTVFGNCKIGGIMGGSTNSVISNAWNVATIEGADDNGGLIGNGSFTLTSSKNSGTVIGNGWDNGGIVGIATKVSSIQTVLNEAPILGFLGRNAGIVGNAYVSSISISNVVNSGSIFNISNGHSAGIVGSLSIGSDISIASSYNTASITGFRRIGSAVGHYYGSEDQRNFSKFVNTGGFQGDYVSTTEVGGIIGGVAEQGTMMMLSLNQVLNLNNSYLDINSDTGSLFGNILWNGVLDKNIWAGASPFPEIPSPVPYRSAYGVKMVSGPITDTNNSGNNDLNLCTDVDNTDSDANICTPAMSAADFYVDTDIGLASSADWELIPLPFSEVVGIGDGAATSFTAMLQLDNILQEENSVKLQLWQGKNLLTATDDGAGNLAEIDNNNGDWLGASTINYSTGELNLSFNTAPELDQVLIIHYTSTDSLPVPVLPDWPWETNSTEFPWSGTVP